MSRRRFYQNKKLDAIPLVCPKDFETNYTKYLKEKQMANIVEEFDNVQYSNKKYCYAVHNNIPRYYNASSTYKQVNEHFLPNTTGIAIVSETLENGEVLKREITLTSGTRSKYQFNTNSTHRWVCICQDSLSGYIPMDTLWYFLGECNSVTRPEYYNNHTTTGANTATYNTINYCHIRANLEIIPESFLQSCKELQGGFICPDSILTIDKRAFQDSNINNIVIRRTNNLKSIGANAFYFNPNNGNLSYKNKINIEMPDSLKNIGEYGLAIDINQPTNIDYTINTLRITPNLSLNQNYFHRTVVKDMIISGVNYQLYNTNSNSKGYNNLFRYVENITIENVIYYDDENEEKPNENAVPYGTLISKIEIDGVIYDNEYYIGKDRGLHWKGLINGVEEDVLLCKPTKYKNTEYSVKIDDGTTILEACSMCISCGRYELVFPDSLKEIRLNAIDNLSNFICVDPFKNKNNLTNILVSNTNIKADENGVLHIPKNVNSLSTTINSNHKGFEIDKDNDEFSSFKGVLYTKDYKTLINIPNGFTGELEIQDNCRELNSIKNITGLTSIIFPQKTEEEIKVNEINGCKNLTNVKLSNNIYFNSHWVFNLAPIDYLTIPEKMVFVRVRRYNSGLTFYTNKIKEYMEDPNIDYSNSEFRVINGMLFGNKNNNLHLINVPNRYSKEYIDIPEGTYALGYLKSPTQNNWDVENIFGNASFENKNIVIPNSCQYIDRMGATSSELIFPEIHIHKLNLVRIDKDYEDTALREDTTKRPYRICRVPINAVGYNGTTYTEKESYIWSGSWCNPINTTSKQISELRFDLVKISGNILNYDNQESFTLTQTGNEVTTLPTDAYNYDHLKTITVPINTDGTYEVWIKNVEYSINNSDTNKITPIGTQITKQIENINGVTTNIVTIDFGNETPTHEKIINITL